MGKSRVSEWAGRLWAKPWQRHLWRYGLAMAAVGLSVLVRLGLRRVLGQDMAFITFYPSVALVGMVAGGWPGVVATLLSALAADWLVLAPSGQLLGFRSPGAMVSLGLFLASGAVVSATAEMLAQVREAERQSVARARRAEQEQRESEERLRLATEAAGMFSWEHDLKIHAVRWSANAAQVIGCPAEALRAEAAGSMFFAAPEEAERLTQQFAAELRAGAERFAWEFYGRALDGAPRYWTAQGRILRNAQGVPVRVLGVTKDITERKWHEANLAFLAGVAKDYGRLASAEAIMETVGTKVGAHLKVDTCSFAEVDLARGELTISYGWRKAEALGQRRTYRLTDFLSTELLTDALEGETIVVCDTQDDRRVSAPGCAAVNVRAFLAVPFHKHGEWKYLLAVTDSRPRHWRPDQVELFHELANRIFPRLERAWAERALRESERRLALALDGGRMGMWEWDPRTDQSVWNAREFELLGLPAADGPAQGELFFQRVHPEDVPRLRQSLAEAAAGGDWTDEFRVVLPEGAVRWLAGAGRVFVGADGQPGRLVGVNYDITERKQFQAELERLVAERTAKLQELVGELEHFSYSITHDMRAPLRAMRAFAEVACELDTEDSREQQRMFLGRIMTAAERMDALITDALNYNKAVRHELSLAPVDVSRLLRGMVDTYPEFQTASADIVIEPAMPLVLGNEAGLTQCFSNLLGNAVKFAVPGKRVEVRVRSETRDGWVRLWVEDKGIGISPSMLPRVFDMFSRGSGAHAGTGIGLALVRKVVDRMGGRVGVESQVGQGSRFWVELKRGDGRRGERR
jgi:PAS domain S-box-containing protein